MVNVFKESMNEIGPDFFKIINPFYFLVYCDTSDVLVFFIKNNQTGIILKPLGKIIAMSFDLPNTYLEIKYD